MAERRILNGFETRSDIKAMRSEVFGSVTFEIKEGKPNGVPKEQENRELTLYPIDMIGLPLMPRREPENYKRSFMYFVPKLGWIAFNLCARQEDCGGPYSFEEEFMGPYLVPEKAHPSDDPVEEAAKEDKPLEEIAVYDNWAKKKA